MKLVTSILSLRFISEVEKLKRFKAFHAELGTAWKKS